LLVGGTANLVGRAAAVATAAQDRTEATLTMSNRQALGATAVLGGKAVLEGKAVTEGMRTM
jgi:hypothetical protein